VKGKADYLTTSQVARILGLSSQRVIQLARDGQIAHSTLAQGMRLFDPVDVERVRLEREAAI
jgi:DNA-binding transcriptional MerR regulator